MRSRYIKPQMDNKFITKTNVLMNELISQCNSADNYEVASIGKPIQKLFEILIQQANKITELEKNVKRLKKIQQKPYRESDIILRHRK